MPLRWYVFGERDVHHTRPTADQLFSQLPSNPTREHVEDQGISRQVGCERVLQRISAHQRQFVILPLAREPVEHTLVPVDDGDSSGEF